MGGESSGSGSGAGGGGTSLSSLAVDVVSTADEEAVAVETSAGGSLGEESAVTGISSIGGGGSIGPDSTRCITEDGTLGDEDAGAGDAAMASSRVSALPGSADALLFLIGSTASDCTEVCGTVSEAALAGAISTSTLPSGCSTPAEEDTVGVAAKVLDSTLLFGVVLSFAVGAAGFFGDRDKIPPMSTPLWSGADSSDVCVAFVWDVFVQPFPIISQQRRATAHGRCRTLTI